MFARLTTLKTNLDPFVEITGNAEIEKKKKNLHYKDKKSTCQ